MNIFRSRVVAVATGAVVVVGLGTTSGYAASMITSAQIANNTIQAADIASDAIRSNEIADGTLRPADLGTSLTEQLALAGTPGVDGKSAYDLAVDGGYNGTLSEWLTSLKGADGTNGVDGTNGIDGINGVNGVDGKTAYELAQQGGYDGTLEEWLASLQGVAGTDGASAYDIWLAQGNTGTPADFLASLKGTDGTNGTDGANGTDGTDGTDGASAYDIWLAQGNTGTPSDFLASLKGTNGADASYVGANWGVVDRNVIGNGLAELRPGPTAAGSTGVIQPPLGIGSLGIHTGSSADKAAFGNQVDFAGTPFSDITKLGFSVFTTGENNGLALNNMPSITFEIDPNLSSSARNYSSLVFAPNNSTANQWTKIDATDDANGAVWGLTGSDLPCNINGARCTWSQVQDALNDGGDPATILTVQITKGRDYAFSGAVDALTINDQVFDFEPFGVK